MRDRHLFVRFTKLDEEKREASGRMTHEIVDRDGEIFDYASSVPHFKAWSDNFDKATSGKSLGNVRAMHKPISAGKVTGIDFNDDERAIDIVVKVVDDAEWEKTKEGVYTGFSIGGNVIRSWRDPADTKHKRFEVNPCEVSLVDYPCVPTATFSYVKLGGVTETRRFTKVAESKAPLEYADAAGAKLPIYSKTLVRASLALWSAQQVRGAYDEKEQETIGRRIRTAAKSFGIEGVTEKAMRAGDYAKGLYDVSRLADLIQSLAWLQQSVRYERDAENDASTVPDELGDHVAGLLATLETMLGEEGDELLALIGHASTTTPTEGTAMADKNTEAGDVVKVSKSGLAALTGALTAFVSELGGGQLAAPVEKVATGDVEKVAKSEYEKVFAERNEFEKRYNDKAAELAVEKAAHATTQALAEELAEGTEKLTAALDVRKGSLRAIDKATDGQPAVEKAATPEPARAEVPAGSVDRPALHSAFKKAFQRPELATATIGE